MNPTPASGSPIQPKLDGLYKALRKLDYDDLSAIHELLDQEDADDQMAANALGILDDAVMECKVDLQNGAQALLVSMGYAVTMPGGVNAAMLDDLKKLNGLPPYDGGSNILLGDGHFAASLEKRYGMTIAQMEQAVDFARVVVQWNEARAEFGRRTA